MAPTRCTLHFALPAVRTGRRLPEQKGNSNPETTTAGTKMLLLSMNSGPENLPELDKIAIDAAARVGVREADTPVGPAATTAR